MKLTTLNVEVPLAKSEGSSLTRKAIITNLSVAKAGNININYSIEVADTNGEIFTPKLTPQAMINIGGGSFGIPLPGQIKEEEETEASHITTFKADIAKALEKFLKVELKNS